MGEIAQILALWRRAQSRGERVCLATVVHVEGSSYRKPGARMLVSAGGERAGTISGGCLEAEVSRKAWWLTANGSVVERYQSSFDDDGEGIAWGLGCGGTVWVLLDPKPATVLQALAQSFEQGVGAAVVSRLQAPAGTRLIATEQERAAFSEELLQHGDPPPDRARLHAAALDALDRRQCSALDQHLVPNDPAPDTAPAFFVEYLAPPPRLSIFGAGDDARPIARFAEALGWRVAVADGRSHLLRQERFPEAAELRLLQYNTAGNNSPVLCGLNEPLATAELPVAEAGTDGDRTGLPASVSGSTVATSAVEPEVQPGELAVILTHSFEQDRALLTALLPKPLAYLGILGPRHRTLRLLEDVAPALGWTVDACFARLHSPIGIDLGARDPAAIALSIVADLQATLTGRHVAVTRARDPKPASPGGGTHRYPGQAPAAVSAMASLMSEPQAGLLSDPSVGILPIEADRAANKRA
ncbi:XdhC family protein [Acidipila sp. EB88]|uniref:XdhC family protein n=1 Tax=Acidipila sp. EB88 TaxID=2305226 RepID=UPI0013155C71|nr:XdhC/CoxI family protein [Acidipila sp. EB88]